MKNHKKVITIRIRNEEICQRIGIERFLSTDIQKYQRFCLVSGEIGYKNERTLKE